MTFKLVKLKIKIKARQEIKLPDYAGSVFRGAFGHAFKKAACFSLEKDCSSCFNRNNCPYIYVFETDYPESAKQIKRLQKPPKPYLIEPPQMNLTDFNSEESLSFGLTIIGDAINYIPYFVFAFIKMGEDGIGNLRGKFSVEDIEAFSQKNNSYYSIFSPDNKNKIDFNEECVIKFTNDNGLCGSELLKLNFLTPINIIKDKCSRHDMEFYTFFSRLVSRINALSLFYCDKEFIENPSELIEMSKDVNTLKNCTSWYSFHRFSNRQKKSLVVGGYLGEILYSGKMKNFMPVIEIGKHVHNGKNTIMGLGKYEYECE